MRCFLPLNQARTQISVGFAQNYQIVNFQVAKAIQGVSELSYEYFNVLFLDKLLVEYRNETVQEWYSFFIGQTVIDHREVLHSFTTKVKIGKKTHAINYANQNGGNLKRSEQS